MRQLLENLTPEELADLEATVGMSAGRGDTSEFETIYALYGQRLMRLMGRSFRGHPPAEDLTQEIFTKAYEVIGRGDFTYRGGSSMYAWLVRIGMNRGINEWRRAKRKTMVPTDFAGNEYWLPAHEDFTDDIASRDYIEGLLGQLSPDAAAAIMAVDIHGDSYTEHAQDAQVARPTVGSRLFRAHAVLRDVLDDE